VLLSDPLTQYYSHLSAAEGAVRFIYPLKVAGERIVKYLVYFLKIKPTRCTNFSNLFLEWNSTGFGQFLCPSSGVFHCTRSNGIWHSGLLTADRLQSLELSSINPT